MSVIKGKCCQKCGSKNVYLEYDLGCWYEHCLICGYIVPLEKMELEKETTEEVWQNNISM